MRLNAQDRARLFGLVVDPLPVPARGSILLDADYCARFKASPKSWFPLDGDIAAETESLHTALTAAVAGRKSGELTLRDGRRIRIKLGMAKGGQATLRAKRKIFAFAYANLLSTDRRKRTRSLKRVLEDRPLGDDEEKKWQAIAPDPPLFAGEYAG